MLCLARTVINLDNTEHLNVLFAFWTMQNLLGYATFPWDGTVYSTAGGTIMNPTTYGEFWKFDTKKGQKVQASVGAVTVHEFGRECLREASAAVVVPPYLRATRCPDTITVHPATPIAPVCSLFSDVLVFLAAKDNLGLYHVFHGVDEMKNQARGYHEGCSNPCYEEKASLEHGDLCADTAPAPMTGHCGVAQGKKCGVSD